MTEPSLGAPPSRRPHAKALSAPFLEFDLGRELHLLRHEPGWQNGQNARTLAKYEDFRVVLIALEAGAGIPEHQAAGRISVQTLSGRIRMRALGRTFNLPVGSLLTLDQGVPHDVEAVEDSAFLLTVAWPGREAPSPPEAGTPEGSGEDPVDEGPPGDGHGTGFQAGG